MGEAKKINQKLVALMTMAIIILIMMVAVKIFGTSEPSTTGTGESSPHFIAIKSYLQSNLNDPASLAIDSYSALKSIPGGLSAMRVKYRAKNVYNALVLKDQVFTMDAQNKVIMVTDYK
jgi:hypothetical protein